MKFSLVDGVRQEPSPKVKGLCQFCGKPTLSKCGTKVKAYVQSVAKDVAPKLCAKFGKKNTYSFHEISWVLNQINRSNDRFYKSVSYGMLLPYSKELALELHEDLGDLLDFQKSVGKILFNVSEVPSFESYLLYAEVNVEPNSKVTNTSLDSSGGINLFDLGNGE
ncbi:hypothetical protein [Vibrio vulnificus]|uniref:hypothetical protein n=1 Tax=Vibrio vulnificus TaxID=672 RepID=UPI001E4ACEF5|nr:hypothetical protein [Vibrio vulnificus]